jgi:hypothetical protein
MLITRQWSARAWSPLAGPVDGPGVVPSVVPLGRIANGGEVEGSDLPSALELDSLRPFRIRGPFWYTIAV